MALFEAVDDSEVLVAPPLLWVAETTLVEFILAGYLRRSYSLLLFLLL